MEIDDFSKFLSKVFKRDLLCIFINDWLTLQQFIVFALKYNYSEEKQLASITFAVLGLGFIITFATNKKIKLFIEQQNEKL